jgi:hypothetical protein
LWSINAEIPQISGWPPWVILLNAPDENFHPYIQEGGWQALLVGNVIGSHVDFWRIEPKGRLYHLRVMADDLADSPRRPKSGTGLDYPLQVIRVAEFLAVAKHIIRALGSDLEQTMLGVACRWTKLSGRRLCSWADQRYSLLRPRDASRQDEIATSAKLPGLGHQNQSTMRQFVCSVMRPLIGRIAPMDTQQAEARDDKLDE